MTLDVYTHVHDELEGADDIDAEAVIRAAREGVGAHLDPLDASVG